MVETVGAMYIAASPHGRHCKAARLHTDFRTSDLMTLATSLPSGPLSSPPLSSADKSNVEPGWLSVTAIATVICTPPLPRPANSIAWGSSYRVTSHWMTLRNPLTLISDETRVPLSIVAGTLLRQPPKIVIQSPKRLRSDASFQAASGDR